MPALLRAVFVLLCVAVVLPAQTVGSADPRFAAVRDSIRAAIAAQSTPSLAVAVAHRGQVLWQEAFGVADLATGRAATPSTLYSLASISKPFTATALMRLVEEGRLSLDAPANRYLTPVPLRATAGHADSATLRRLLTHTAGLGLHYQFFYAGGPPRPPMDSSIARYGWLLAAPGARYFYANFGYGLLDEIVARVGGASFAEFTTREVLAPLGLRNTVISDGSDLGARAALRYDARNAPVPPYTFDHLGASAFWSSAEDLLRFGMFHVGTLPTRARAVLRNDTRLDMQRTHAIEAPGSAATRGLGWQVVPSDRGLTRVSHTGGMPGVSTVLNLYPAESLVVVVLANKSTPYAGRVATMIRDVIAPPVPAAATAAAPQPASAPTPWRPDASWRGEWRGEAHVHGATVPVVLRIDSAAVHVGVGNAAAVPWPAARAVNGWLSGTVGRFPQGGEATPAADTAGFNATWNLEQRDGALAGWVSAISRADPTFGAVSYPVRLTRVASAPPTIDSTHLQVHLRALTAPALEGRGAGYVGDSLAAGYLAEQFQRAGLLPVGDDGGYLQRFDLHARRPAQPFEVLRTQNVVALLPGRDPARRSELVVIGAHFDGQGMPGQADVGRRIPDGSPSTAQYPSANDNGAATAALVAIAEAMAQDPPQRSVLFVAFGAEEHGLVGSLHYVAHPVRPWAQHVAMINLEMIGWEPARDVNVRATGTSRDWDGLLTAATARTGTATTRTQLELTNDTDHYGFGVRGLPVVHYGVPGSREHYHATTDSEDRIAYGALARRAAHAMTLARLVADAPTRPRADWVHPPDLGITYVPLTTAEYARAALPDSVGALKLNAVAMGLPAHAAGLQAGDLLTAVNGSGWRRTQSPAALLRVATVAAADTGHITLRVIRSGAAREVVVPMSRSADAAPRTELVMLGTGTPNADPDRSGPAVAVVRAGSSYLVDAGPGIVRRAAAAAREGVDALEPARLKTLFLTHLHHDHTLGLPDVILGPWTLEREVPIRIFGPPGTKRMVELILQAYEPDIRNRIDGAEPANTTGWRAEVTEVVPGEVYRDSNVVVTAFAVPHGDWAQAFGYTFTTPERKIVISGDTRASDAVVAACDGCDLLVHEVFSAERFAQREPAWQRYHAAAHTSTVELAALATRARPAQLLLYHQLYWGTDDAGLIAELRAAGYRGPVQSARDLGRY